MKPRHTLEKDTWQRQTRTNLDTWKTWQKLLVKTICNKYEVLNTLLGKWTIVTRKWEEYSHNEHIYIKKGKWYTHLITKKARSTCTAKKIREEAKVPSGAIPITDVKEGNMIMFTPPIPRKRRITKERENNKTFQEFLQNQPRWIRQLIENAKHKEGQERLKEMMMLEEGIW
eukprot:6048836-Ditylum_brightwellii.AAC.1